LKIFVEAEGVEVTLLVDALVPAFLRGKLRAVLESDDFAVARSVPKACDVLWYPWNGTFFESTVPAVATVHDVVPFAYPAGETKRRLSQQRPFLRSAAESVAIVTDSEFSAREIELHLAVPRERVLVIPLGVGAPFGPGEPGQLPAALAGQPYVLAIGSDEPHKNMAPLIAAFEAVYAKTGVKLALLGATAPPGDASLALGPLTEAELLSVVRGARLLAAPGIYEGFGLPALEAMACGTPVLTARAGAAPEVCAEAAAYLDAPLEPQAWEAALLGLLGHDEALAELRRRGPERAAGFTWERTAGLTLEVLRRCASA
jgi:alpha-1,3-rhamnosyl/mannosyltransferase